jgi:hypothetical protein
VNALTTDRIRDHATRLGLTHLSDTITDLVTRAEAAQVDTECRGHRVTPCPSSVEGLQTRSRGGRLTFRRHAHQRRLAHHVGGRNFQASGEPQTPPDPRPTAGLDPPMHLIGPSAFRKHSDQACSAAISAIHSGARTHRYQPSDVDDPSVMMSLFDQGFDGGRLEPSSPIPECSSGRGAEQAHVRPGIMCSSLDTPLYRTGSNILSVVVKHPAERLPKWRNSLVPWPASLLI